MKKLNLDEIPQLLKSGKIKQKDALNYIVIFINQNPALFGLQKFSEDFRSEISLYLLEKGESFINNYDSSIGDFFTYLFGYILNIETFIKRKAAIGQLRESIYYEQAKRDFSTQEDEENIFEEENNLKKIMPEEIKNRNVKLSFNKNKNKTLLILAIKACFELTDSMIKKICDFYEIKEEDFRAVILELKEKLQKKTDKKTKLIEKRNHNYFLQKKYETQINILKNEENQISSYLINDIKILKEKQKNNENQLTKKINRSIKSSRPTNRDISKILDIAERNVGYCLFSLNKKSEKEASKKILKTMI